MWFVPFQTLLSVNSSTINKASVDVDMLCFSYLALSVPTATVDFVRI